MRQRLQHQKMENNDEPVSEVLKRLRKQMENEGSAEKLNEDLAVDFSQCYKSNSFDPKIPVKIQLTGHSQLLTLAVY